MRVRRTGLSGLVLSRDVYHAGESELEYIAFTNPRGVGGRGIESGFVVILNLSMSHDCLTSPSPTPSTRILRFPLYGRRKGDCLLDSYSECTTSPMTELPAMNEVVFLFFWEM